MSPQKTTRSAIMHGSVDTKSRRSNPIHHPRNRRYRRSVPTVPQSCALDTIGENSPAFGTDRDISAVFGKVRESSLPVLGLLPTQNCFDSPANQELALCSSKRGRNQIQTISPSCRRFFHGCQGIRDTSQRVGGVCRGVGFSRTMMSSAIVLFVFLLSLHHASAIETETCTYDIDFTTNSAKITCKGGPASVSVYANTATVQADGVYNTGGGGGGDDGQSPNSALQKHDSKKHPHRQRPSTSSSKTGGRGGGGGSKNRLTGKPGGGSGGGGKSGAPQSLRQTSEKEPKDENPMDDVERRDDEFNEKHAAIHSSAFSDVVMNATHKLKRAKRQLSTYSDSIRNLSAYLKEGDENLREDMERLRKTSNSANELKEGISAAMRNQFSYLRYSMTIRSHELERLVNSLTVLVDVTSEGLEGALMAHKAVLEEVAHVNRTIRAVRRKMIREMRKRYVGGGGKKSDKPKSKCPKEISAIGAGTARQMSNTPVGSYMVESYKSGPYQPVWIVEGSAPTDQILEFDADVDVDYNLVATYYALPYQCVGTGHAVFRRHLYCHLAGGQSIAKYHLSKMDPVSEFQLPGTGVENFSYRSGLNTSVDLAVDEMGLWVIFANHESGGKIVIAKVNHRQVMVERTWTTSFPKSHAGNAFMICGVLYVTDSHTDVPTYIRYMYDTETGTERRLDSGQIPFPNSALLGVTEEEPTGKGWGQHEMANVSMLSYDFKQSKIFAWNTRRIEAFPVYFKKEPAE